MDPDGKKPSASVEFFDAKMILITMIAPSTLWYELIHICVFVYRSIFVQVHFSYFQVSRNTPEEEYSKNRQSFLENQGYTYETKTLEELRNEVDDQDDQELQYQSNKDQTELLKTVKVEVYGK